LYEQGAAGNMAPIYTNYPSASAGHLSEFRVLLGDKVLEALQRMGPATDAVTMSTSAITVSTPRKNGLVWPEELASYAVAEAGRPMVKLPVRFLRINAGGVILRNRYERAKPLALPAHFLFRLHERLVRLFSDGAGVPGWRLRTKYLGAYRAGGRGSDSGRDRVHPGLPALNPGAARSAAAGLLGTILKKDMVLTRRSTNEGVLWNIAAGNDSRIVWSPLRPQYRSYRHRFRSLIKNESNPH
jgi:hypothetical protein